MDFNEHHEITENHNSNNVWATSSKFESRKTAKPQNEKRNRKRDELKYSETKNQPLNPHYGAIYRLVFAKASYLAADRPVIRCAIKERVWPREIGKHATPTF